MSIESAPPTHSEEKVACKNTKNRRVDFLKSFLLIDNYLAHFTQCTLSGLISKRPSGISCPHFTHFPKSLLSRFFFTYSSFLSFSSAFRKADSFTLRLLIASMRDTRPIALSGDTGCVISL